MMKSNNEKRIMSKLGLHEDSLQHADILRDDGSETWLYRSAAIARRVVSALKAKNMMQKELAMTIGFRPQQVSRILKGNINLTIKTVARLEAALGITLLEVPAGEVRSGKRKQKNVRNASSKQVGADNRRAMFKISPPAKPMT